MSEVETGWLWKATRKLFDGYRKGWWVLDSKKNTFEEYSSPKLTHLSTVLYLHDIAHGEKLDNSQGFKLVLVNGEFLKFKAKTVADRDRWLNLFGEFFVGGNTSSRKSVNSQTIPSSLGPEDGEVKASRGSPSKHFSFKNSLSALSPKTLVKNSSKAAMVIKKDLDVPSPQSFNESSFDEWHPNRPFSLSTTDDVVLAQNHRSGNSTSHYSLNTAGVVEITNSFKGARNFASATSKFNLESLQKKGHQMVENRSEKRLAVVAPINQHEESVDPSRFVKTNKEKELLKNVINNQLSHFLGANLMKDIKPSQLVDLMYQVKVDENVVIQTQGEATDRMYVLENGTVGVYSNDFVNREPDLEFVYQEGDSFGIMSLVYNQPGPFTFRTHTVCNLWTLPRKRFQEFITAVTIRRVRKKLRLLEHIPVIAGNLDQAAMVQLADMLKAYDYVDGETIIRTGEVLKHMFIVESGIVNVMSNGVKKSYLKKGGTFGEWALLDMGVKSDATVVAEGVVSVLKLDISEVADVIGPIRTHVLKKWTEKNSNRHFFAHLGKGNSSHHPAPFANNPPSSSQLTLSNGNVVGTREFSQQSLEIQSNHSLDLANSQHSLETSQHSINSSQNSLDKISEDKPVANNEISASSLLGKSSVAPHLSPPSSDRSLPVVVAVVPRTSNANTNRTSETPPLSRQSLLGFEHLKGMHPASVVGVAPEPLAPAGNKTPTLVLMQDNSNSSGAESGSSDAAFEEDNLDQEFDRCLPQRPEMVFDKLKFLALLGRGAFGRVHLAKFEDREMVAVKVISRHFVTSNGWERLIENELKSMLEISACVHNAHSAFVLKLFNYFTDSKNVYFILEFCDGGDLYSLMKATKIGRLNESTARFYVACAVEGLDLLQSRNIVYRDLKAENLMLSQDGYAKLVDFGLAKKTLRTFTVCGTPDYMAPEVILSRGHGLSVDWWALGVFFFEMLFGYTPFSGHDTVDVYQNILEHRTWDDFPYHRDVEVSDEAKDLIQALVNPKKNKRLGFKFPGVKALRSHAFFKGFEWNALLTRTMDSPSKPQAFDVSKTNDNYDAKLLAKPDDHSGWTLSF